MSDHSEAMNPFFRLVALAGALFVVTILALVAVPFGDPAAPVAQWLNRNGGVLIGAEVALILVLGFLAMLVDRRQTIRRTRRADPRQSTAGREAAPD